MPQLHVAPATRLVLRADTAADLMSINPISVRHEAGVPADDLGAGMVKGGKFCQRLFRIQLVCRRLIADNAAGQNSY